MGGTNDPNETSKIDSEKIDASRKESEPELMAEGAAEVEPTPSELEKAEAKLSHWQHTKKAAASLIEPSPVTVGDLQKESLQYHSKQSGEGFPDGQGGFQNLSGERDKNPFQPDPLRRHLFEGGAPAGLDINKGIRYDPIEYSPTDPTEFRPITGGNFRQVPQTPSSPVNPSPTYPSPMSPSPSRSQGFAQHGVDPLNFSRTGFTDDPAHPSVDVRHLVGPDGTQDTLRGASLNDRIMMGEPPVHRGMPSPPPSDATPTDIRAPATAHDLLGLGGPGRGLGGHQPRNFF
ncbi:hypothetical protein GNI_003830 [Gregarina niphandrodes]|uniref:Uncharacterized protein n=1 Tax=Gregarina niphandrodes TaxID=110365 RepID=A0A023BDX9_GRENI|nr:hypothetical protein GNI_003830 [Gregarina niphandrodes]EZG88832.1 hypothetical protein GNI_003830 [Gregarina niphandrodes]|eukprot:XP_011128531.1 hypothetical protein GNI_003830 [Gregarina niphandrodes]